MVDLSIMVQGTVRCLYCRKKIGLVRRVHDRHFCCDEHRKKLMSKSARVIREAEELYGLDDANTVSFRTVMQAKGEEKQERRSGYGTSLFVSMAIVFILLALTQVSNDTPAAKPVSALPDAHAQNSKGGFGKMLTGLIQSKTSGSMHEDFRTGFANWEGLRSSGPDWVAERDHIRPGSLRIWKPSQSMANYQLDFVGQIDHKSMDWAFRAADTKNYYATKLTITRPGPLPNAGLVRFVVLDGRERERVELPLPLTLERGVDYRVRVNVEGRRFLTSVNGQVVSSWTDSRLSRGGVGFFSEDGESSLLKSVSLSERDSFLSRIVSYFSLISFPTAALPPAP